MNKLSNILTAILVAGMVFSVEAAYSQESGSKMKQDVFSQVLEAARVVGGAKQITYEQLMKIRNSGEPYILVDVRTPDKFREGHIDGALSFFLDSINANSASQVLPKGSKIITYSRNFSSSMSTKAARKLAGLGYDVLDYKGGYQEWRGKGNR